MAQLLVFNRDNIHADPKTDAKGCYKNGDVVVVAEDTHQFGTAEKKHPFSIVQVPGVAAYYQHLLESEPATLRDKYPRSMIAIKRLHPKMQKEIRKDIRVRRKYSVDRKGTASQKRIPGV